MFEKVSECPICKNNQFKNELICLDTLTSEESFVLTDCKSCGFRITNPRPNEKSITKYYPSNEYLPHQDKAANLFQFVYRSARSYNLVWKHNLIKKLFPKPETLLDFGAGTGEFLAHMKKKKWEVAGVEPGQKARRFAIKNQGLNIVENILQLPDIQPFKIITLWHVLEHVHQLNERLADLYNLLAKNGRIIIAVPNYKSYDAQKYAEHWAGYDVPRHLYHFNQSTMKALLNNSGLVIESIVPMKLDAYYVSILSERNISSKFPALHGLAAGFKSNRWAKKNDNNYSSLVYIAKK